MATRKRSSSGGFSSTEQEEVEILIDQTVDELLSDIEAAEEFVVEATPDPDPEPEPEPEPVVEVAPETHQPVQPKPNPPLITRPRRNIPRFVR